MSTTIATTRITRLTYHDGDKVLACQATSKASCPKHQDVAVYRIERISQETGEVWSRVMCTNAAAAWAARYQVPFPPGPARPEAR